METTPVPTRAASRPRPRHLPAVAVALALALTGGSMLFGARASIAMPEFAQATGLQCSACHTMVPLLNAYGRYVQRTGYAALDRAQLVNTFPLWVSESANYDSTAGAGTGVNRYDFGNLAVHAIGYLAPDITYHAQQWITQGSASGGVDTLWIADNHVFTPDAHLFVGKVLSLAPSPYSQTLDIDGPTASNTIVGEHDWSMTYGNRWGTHLNFVRKGLDIEAGYMLSGDDMNGITDFNPGDRTFQWKAAFAKANSPFEIGAFGTAGSIPVSTGIDQYSSVAGYAQLDPTGAGIPGMLLIYQGGRDSSPGMSPAGTPYGVVTSRGYSAELFEPILHNKVVLSFRHDFNDAGVAGGTTNGNAINAAFSIPGTNYLHGYVEANFGANSALAGGSGGPTWKGMLWLTVPVVLKAR